MSVQRDERTGKSLTDYMGTTDRDAIIESVLKPYKMYKDGVVNKEYGTSVFAEKMATAYQDAASLKLMEDKDFGPIGATLSAMQQRLSPQIMSTVLGDAVMRGSITKIGTAFGNFTSEKIVKSWEQPDIRAARNLAPRSLKEDIEDAAKKLKIKD